MKKSNFFVFSLVVFVTLLLFYCCNSSAPYEEQSADSVSAPNPTAATEEPTSNPSPNTTDSSTFQDLPMSRPDTVTMFPPEVGKSAVLGYSYPERIRRKEVKNVNAFLTVNLPESKVRDTLKKITEKQLRHLQKDDTT